MKRKHPPIDPLRRYGIKEVCDLLCIHRDTVRKYTRQEVIVPIIISRREIYYLGEEVERLYQALTKPRSHAEDR